MIDLLKRMFPAATQAAIDSFTSAVEQSPEAVLIAALDALDTMRTDAQDIAHPFEEQMRELERAKIEALGNLAEQMLQQEHRIKEMAMKIGKNVFGATLKAEYVHASSTVDVKGLLGYAVDHPEVKQFIVDGKPSCRIKPISANERKALALAALN